LSENFHAKMDETLSENFSDRNGAHTWWVWPAARDLKGCSSSPWSGTWKPVHWV
jgi:hypothetical protein